jgi:nucleotide-binding universal stress UspA family protein
MRQHANLLGAARRSRGNAAVALAAAAAEHGRDLILMATGERTGLQGAVLGSVAGNILRMSRTLVSLVHAVERTMRAPEPRDPSASAPF